MKKWIRAVLAGTIILALILFGIFAAQNTQKSTKPEQNPEEQNTSVSENSTSDESTAENSTDDPDIIVKDNVKVITNEMKSEDQPTEVSDNSLNFRKRSWLPDRRCSCCGRNQCSAFWIYSKSSADRKNESRLPGRNRARRPCWMYSKRHILSNSSG